MKEAPIGRPHLVVRERERERERWEGETGPAQLGRLGHAENREGKERKVGWAEIERRRKLLFFYTNII